MVKTIRTFFLSLTILAFLLFSTVGTTTVLADDGTGTEPAATETAPPTEEEQPAQPVTDDATPPADEEQPTEPVVEETPTPGEEPLPTEPVVEEPVVEETAPAETLVTILEQVPDNTTVTVLNSEGEALPLASQESADAIASDYDPIWCPAGQVPTPGANGCTPSFASFDELLAYLQANEASYSAAGTIYIQQGDYLGGETSIDFNNYNFDTFDQYDLTLQGGWDTSYSPASGAPTFTTTNFNVPIIIGSSSNPWAGSLTLNNINISGVSGQTGLTLYSANDINLDQVNVTDSQSGAYLEAGGDVVVKNSNFKDNASSNNDGYGLKVKSGGTATLDNVNASLNQAFGADVTAGGAVSISQSVFSGNVSYQYGIATGGYGLSVVSQGAVTADGVTANDNYYFGAHLEGVNVTLANGTFNGNGSGDVERPIGKGLEVVSTGTVTLSSITANNNQVFGASVDAVGNVVVTNGFFNSNQGYYYLNGWVYEGYGLQVVTDGNITLNGVTANDNYLYGARLEGAVIKVSNSFFSENNSDWHEHSTGFGLQVVGTGDVTLSNVTANDNQRWGADITTTEDVEVIDSFFNGNVSYIYSSKGEKIYYGYGLRIDAGDDVSLENVEAMNNNLYGAHIEAQNVAIDTANFSGNGSGDALDMTGYGLQIASDLGVALIHVTANNNQLFGADIAASGAVAISQSYFNGHIVYYHDYFSGEILNRDGGYGLRVVTLGPIALDQVTATGNYLYGAYLEGARTTVEDSSFTANGSGVITDPTGYGLMIDSSERVILIGVDASNNQLFGADIKAKGRVTITNSFFSGHQTVTFTPCLGLTFYGYGLTVVTPDDISLNGVEANFNNLWGASLTGDDITVSHSQFNNNVSDSNIFIDDTGLIINAADDVNIWDVEANENRLIGAVVTAGGDVSVVDSFFNDNRGYTCLYDWCPEGSITYYGYGLQVTTPGEIYVSGTNANNNNLFGATLNGGLVEVEDSNFNNNGMGNGLTINATDNVTLTNVTALKNGGNGVEVDGVCQKIVTVTGGTFSDNALYGLKVVDATLNIDGTQTFANNGSGNVFTDTSTCVVVIPTITTTVTQTTTTVLASTVSLLPSTTLNFIPKKSLKFGMDKMSNFRKLRRG